MKNGVSPARALGITTPVFTRIVPLKSRKCRNYSKRIGLKLLFFSSKFPHLKNMMKKMLKLNLMKYQGSAQALK